MRGRLSGHGFTNHVICKGICTGCLPLPILFHFCSFATMPLSTQLLDNNQNNSICELSECLSDKKYHFSARVYQDKPEIIP